METIDWKKVAHKLTPEKGRVPYQENKHLFTKVAFDVFQLNSSPVEAYWTLEKDDDGTEYLVATYDVDSSEPGLEAKSHWEALSDKSSENVTLFYRGVPIKRFASNEYKFDASDVHIFKSTLVEKLTKEADFVGKLLEVLPDEKKDALVRSFPELTESE